MTFPWIGLLGGIAVIIASIVMIVKRDAVARWNAKSITRMWGSLAAPVSRSSQPRTLVFVALGHIFIASVFVLRSLETLLE
jgi:hypothetical protein